MRKLKSIAVCALCLCLLLSLAGCAAAQRPLRVTLVLKTETDVAEFWGMLLSGVRKAAEEYGVDLTVRTSPTETAIDEQIELIRQTAAEKPDVMILSAADYDRCAEATEEAIAAGIDVLGENRVQEMTEKLSQNAYDGAPLHFIGHLQRNKVKQVVGKVALIQSVGSLPLLEAVEKEAEKQDIVQDILLEVNIGGEEAKSGFAPESLEQAAEEAKKCANVRVRGLMCIPPVAEGEHGSLPYFEKVHALFVDINAKLYDNTLDILSMGMSGDYEDAVRAGATMVRVGTAIFGARNYTI